MNLSKSLKIKAIIIALMTQKHKREIKAESHDNFPKIIKNNNIKTAGILTIKIRPNNL